MQKQKISKIYQQYSNSQFQMRDLESEDYDKGKQKRNNK